MKQGKEVKNTLLEMAHLIGLRNSEKDDKYSNFHNENNIDEKNKIDDLYPISVDGRNSNSLNVFLRKSSLLCELIMNEQSNLKNEKKKEFSQNKAADGKIFNSNVVTLGVRNKMTEEKESDMVTNYAFDYYCYCCCYYYYVRSLFISL